MKTPPPKTQRLWRHIRSNKKGGITIRLQGNQVYRHSYLLNVRKHTLASKFKMSNSIQGPNGRKGFKFEVLIELSRTKLQHWL